MKIITSALIILTYSMFSFGAEITLDKHEALTFLQNPNFITRDFVKIKDTKETYKILKNDITNYMSSTEHQARLALGLFIEEITLKDKDFNTKGWLLIRFKYSNNEFRHVTIGNKKLIKQD